MNLEGLIAEFRRRVDDQTEPYLHSDEAVIGWANEAEREAALRAKLIHDPDFDRFALVPGQSDYTISPLVIALDRLTVALAAGGRPYDLDLTGSDALSDQRDWHSRRGRPTAAAWAGETLRLWPEPDRAGTVQVVCYRYPRAAMTQDSDEPEIHQEWHAGLVDWIVYRAASCRDADTYDEGMAAMALAEFTRNFGARDTANVVRRHRERRRVTTRMAW